MNFIQYNQALLAKQAWRILVNPTSLLTQVLRTIYFSNSNFLESKEGGCPSLTWRSICWGKNLLILDLRRQIGNRQNTRAFKDPWLSRPPSFLLITQGLNENAKVSELIQQPGKWNNELIQQWYLIPDSQLISTIPLSPFEHTDSWLWHYNSNWNYSVKSGYNLAMAVNADNSGPTSSSEVMSIWWKAFWAIQIPRKILIFAWRGYNEILPTTKGLQRRNVSFHSNCPLCSFGEDFNAHAVFWCSFSQKVWGLLDFPFWVGHKEEISFKCVLLYAIELLEKDDLAKMLITTWGIWSERNKKTHGLQQRTPEQIKIRLASYYDDIVRARAQVDKSLIGGVSSRGGQVEIEFNNLTLLVDASISTPSKKVGLGAAIFTSDKRIKATLSKPLEGDLSVVHAEALALLVGLLWVHSIGLQVIKILTDSLTVVQALDNNVMYHNELGIFLSDIIMLLLNFLGASISHVSRKFNGATHNLAKYALQLDDEASWMEEISPFTVSQSQLH